MKKIYFLISIFCLLISFSANALPSPLGPSITPSAWGRPGPKGSGNSIFKSRNTEQKGVKEASEKLRDMLLVLKSKESDAKVKALERFNSAYDILKYYISKNKLDSIKEAVEDYDESGGNSNSLVEIAKLCDDTLSSCVQLNETFSWVEIICFSIVIVFVLGVLFIHKNRS